MILRHGGRIVINPGENTFLCFAANPRTLLLKNLIKQKKYNIATVDWLRKVFGGDNILSELPKLHPHDMLCQTSQMENEFIKRYDDYGDSYSDKINMLQIKLLLDKIIIEVNI